MVEPRRLDAKKARTPPGTYPRAAQRVSELRRLSLKGFKSIKDMDLELRPLNVLIGANGAGKSNLVSFFRMVNEMIAGRLQQYISSMGHAHALLHYGPKITPRLEATLVFHGIKKPVDQNTYRFVLSRVEVDTLAFAEETLGLLATGPRGRKAPELSLGSGQMEARIKVEADRGERRAKFLRHLLNQCRVYHFHDTSDAAPVRQYGYVGDSHPLRHDAGNLAAFLYRLKQEPEPTTYHRIVTTIRLIAPFFDDFVLEPKGTRQEIILNWREKGSEEVFGPYQISDGTLRAMCLVALLLQPETDLPHMIVIDEPELGLHPYALNLIASLFKMASHHSQVLISTQSSPLVDNFEPEDIIVVDRRGKESVFTRPDLPKLESWLDEYSLGEVWENNIIGGGPH